MSELESLLEHAKRAGPAPELKARLRKRVLLAASAGLAASSVASASHAAGAAAASSAKSSWLVSVAVSLALGVGAGAVVTVPLVLRETSRRAQPVASAKQALPRPGQSSGTPPSAHTPSAAETPAPRLSSAAHGTDSAPAHTATPGLPSIQRETELLTEAQGALQRGEPRAALSALNRYDAQIKSGALAEEALAVRAMAECALLPSAAGERSYNLFVARYAGSPLLPRVQTACRRAGP